MENNYLNFLMSRYQPLCTSRKVASTIATFSLGLFLATIPMLGQAADYSVEAGHFSALNITDNWNTAITSTNYKKYSTIGSNVMAFTKSGPNAGGSTLCATDSQWLPGSGTSGDIYPITTIDGYQGIKIAEGVIVVPMNLNVTASGKFSNYKSDNADDAKAYTTSITSNNKGDRSKIGTNSNPTIWCSIMQNLGDTYTWIQAYNFTSNGSVSWGVYASASAPAGNYTIPNIFVGQSLLNSDLHQYTASKLTGNKITVRRPLECKITSPTSVDFGKVNITGKRADELLAAKSGDLKINCASDTADAVADMTISFTGALADKDWGRLNVTNTKNESMAYIRGRYLNFAGNCSPYQENQIGFDGTSALKKIQQVKNGTLTLPLTWSLCGNASGLMGKGSAQATININWE